MSVFYKQCKKCGADLQVAELLPDVEDDFLHCQCCGYIMPANDGFYRTKHPMANPYTCKRCSHARHIGPGPPIQKAFVLSDLDDLSI